MRRTKEYLDRYSFSVSWSAEDEAYIARVLEFPLLAAHGQTQQAALREIRVALKGVIEDMLEHNEEIPKPFGEENFSGRLNVRMPKYLHRRLAMEAAAEGISLNQLMLLKLEHVED